jgi:hypothetical protein
MYARLTRLQDLFYRPSGDKRFLGEPLRGKLLLADVHENEQDELERTLLEAFGKRAHLVHTPPVPRDRMWGGA